MRSPSRITPRCLTAPLCGILGVGTAVLSSTAQIVDLTEGNTLIQIFPAQQAGMFNWFVDGQDYLSQQQFWFRVGSAGPEASLNTLTLSSISQPYADQATINYTSAAFDVQVSYSLTGGSLGSGASDVNEAIKISNKTGGVLDFHLFLYTDFDLNSTPGGDTVTSVSWAPFPISAPGYSSVTQVDGLDLNQTTLGTFANRAEALPFNQTLNKLNDGVATDLLNSGASFGPTPVGDATYAFQWNLAIAQGASKTITVDKRLEIQPVPEPTTAALSLLGLAALFQAARRRQV